MAACRRQVLQKGCVRFAQGFRRWLYRPFDTPFGREGSEGSKGSEGSEGGDIAFGDEYEVSATGAPSRLTGHSEGQRRISVRDVYETNGGKYKSAGRRSQ